MLKKTYYFVVSWLLVAAFSYAAFAITPSEIKVIEEVTDALIDRDPDLLNFRSEIIVESAAKVDQIRPILFDGNKGIAGSVAREVGRAVIGAVVGEVARGIHERMDRPSQPRNERPTPRERPAPNTHDRRDPAPAPCPAPGRH